MGIRGHIQVKHPEYGKEEFSSWWSYASYRYLGDKSVNISTPNGYGAEDDTWEIEVDDSLPNVVAELRKNPDALVEYARSEEERKDVKGCAGKLADFLEEGLKSAKENGYDYIIIDWF